MAFLACFGISKRRDRCYASFGTFRDPKNLVLMPKNAKKLIFIFCPFLRAEMTSRHKNSSKTLQNTPKMVPKFIKLKDYKYSLRNEKCPDCKYGDFFIIYYSNLKSSSRFGQLIEFYVQKCPWMLKSMKYKAAYGPIRIRHGAGVITKLPLTLLPI